ncbi:hypothetical protein E1B28_000145 [Marasmius oreades]|uniref:MARVEL domain-containing protein n=1 Tax=Marasmius oreades TaxID=181124 RepID=A0A9P7V0U4_9AGAR|nr:uncharacterized protein E1B28_000145 [Marasmius oreades]KAG7098177.1 hypothetical protein E1B28_000145 [Marasmius oreades]
MAGIDLISTRAWLYVVLLVFSFILFALCATRISFTNENFGGHDPSVVELLVTTILTMIWCAFMLFLFFRDTVNPIVRFYLHEIIALLVLWILWLGGAAAASSVFSGVEFCPRFEQCSLLSAILAFAWLGWITLTAIVAVSAWVSRQHGGLGTTLHGRGSSRAKPVATV